MLSGKYVERKIRRLTDEEVKRWVRAKSSLAKSHEDAKAVGGVPGLRLSPIGYTIKDRGDGFYKLKPKQKAGTILVTKGAPNVVCGSCKGWNCDHVRAVEHALGRKKGSP